MQTTSSLHIPYSDENWRALSKPGPHGALTSLSVTVARAEHPARWDTTGEVNVELEALSPALPEVAFHFELTGPLLPPSSLDAKFVGFWHVLAVVVPMLASCLRRPVQPNLLTIGGFASVATEGEQGPGADVFVPLVRHSLAGRTPEHVVALSPSFFGSRLLSMTLLWAICGARSPGHDIIFVTVGPCAATIFPSAVSQVGP